MRLAIMQPYFFPYLGYFQLLQAVDRFVYYDDVAFIKQGWINRNRMLVQGRPVFFSVPLADASSFRAIRETRISTQEPWRKKMLRRFQVSYGRAPFFAPTFELVQQVLEADHADIASLSRASVEAVCRHLEIMTARVPSSAAYGNAALTGPERVLDICQREGADTYVNAAGGRALYDPEVFRGRGVTLRFLSARPLEYPQLGDPFVPGLSILDVLMFNSPERARTFLGEYDLAA
jgi:hypothetical protein